MRPFFARFTRFGRNVSGSVADHKPDLNLEPLEDRAVPAATTITSNNPLVPVIYDPAQTRPERSDDVDTVTENLNAVEAIATTAREDDAEVDEFTRSVPLSTDTFTKAPDSVGNAPIIDDGQQRAEPAQIDLAEVLRTTARDTFEDPVKFRALLQTVYGDYNPVAAEIFRQAVLRGDNGQLPRVVFLDRETLLGANGAYSAADRVIYLAHDLKDDPARLGQTAMEEVGHYLDTVLKKTDTRGDEGELFRRLAAGEKLDQTQIAKIQTENDHGTITVQGRTVDVEFWSLKKAWKKVKKAASAVAHDIAHTVKQVGKSVVGGVIKTVNDFVADLGKVGNKLIHGHFIGAGKAFGNTIFHAAKNAVGTVIDAGITGFWGAIDIATDLFQPPRKLTAPERDFLRSIYGDSVDLGAIRIYTPSVRAHIGGAHTIGNHIYLKYLNHDTNGELTFESKQLLAHEVFHVWQSQNRSNGYIHDSVFAQGKEKVGNAIDKLLGLPRSHAAYDYRPAFLKGTDFRAMNPEQQASLVEGIAGAVIASGGITLQTLDGSNKELFRGALERSMGFASGTLTGERYDRVIAIWSYVQSAGTVFLTPPREASRT